MPFTVLTKKSLAKLKQVKVLILSNVNMMDEEEVTAIRDWVRAGGCLYASGGSSLVTKRGQMQKDFMLADVFGVSIKKADWIDREHYVTPTPAGQRFFASYDARYPAFVKGYGMETGARPGAEVFATTSLGWPTTDSTKFSSIHSNPPWAPTGHPEIVFNCFGQGRAIYCASVIESVEGLADTFIQLIRFLNADYHFEADAPSAVEVTLFHQPERRRYVLSLVNFQKELPNIPVNGAEIRLRLPERVKAVRLLPHDRPIKHRTRGAVVSFTAPELRTFAMFEIKVG